MAAGAVGGGRSVFERFTREARRVVVRAQEEALVLGHNYLGTEHLLLGMFGEDTVAVHALASLNVHRQAVVEAVREIIGECPELAPRPDPEALASVGIDLDEVRRSVEASFGAGALEGTCAWTRGRGRRFTPRAKKVLQLSLREAIALGHRYLGPEHVLLGMIREGEGVAAEIIRRRAGSLEIVRQAVLDRVRRPA
jgi:ATP-dependent Clp protease ATP-binding subunit ClpA